MAAPRPHSCSHQTKQASTSPAHMTSPLELARSAPFPLYGLANELPGGRRVRTIDRGGEADRVRRVGLAYGHECDRSEGWVEVAVLGPLVSQVELPPEHFRARDTPIATRMSIESLVISHLVTSVHEDAPDGTALGALQTEVGNMPWRELRLHVDDHLVAFRYIQRGRHWGAVTTQLAALPRNHGIVVCASHIKPSSVILTRVRDLAGYAGTH